MLRHFFTLGLLLAIAFPPGALAQSSSEDVLYLKDGSIIRGIIIEQIPDSVVRIQTKDRSVFVFPMTDVVKIAREETLQGNKERMRLTSETIKKRGYVNITEIAVGLDILHNSAQYAIDESDNGDFIPSAGIQTVNGFLFNPYFSAGIGIGFHVYSDLNYVPLFADVRFYFNPSPLKSFFSMGAGYSFSGKDVYGFNNDRSYSGGIYLNPALGFQLHLRSHLALAFSLGYRYQESEIRVTDYTNSYQYYSHPPGSSRANYTLGYLITRVGFVF